MKNWLRIILAAAKPAYGGQAVVNGVMMMGKKHYAISVTTSKHLVTKTFPHTPLNQRNKLFALPFVRGVVNLIDMFFVGYKSLMYSAEVAGEQETNSPIRWFETVLMYGSILFSFALAIFLFKFLPLSAATFLDSHITLSSTAFNIIDGLVKMTIFVGYIVVISLYKDVKDLFRYHGGEHKTINCYEAGLPLTINNISKQNTVHVRCGTTFIFVVIFISILVYLVIPKELPLLYNLVLRLALLPLIAAIAYEFQRLSAKSSSKFLRALFTPGLWLQSLTVYTPAPRHMRAGRASLQAVLKAEEKK
ncbi:DUF1385 domain-containing protein [Candidatus Woesearchaeota archaeon]|nr:DUF1385 domain-containing protein [Candidatus Woesearchaeota archaeon]